MASLSHEKRDTGRRIPAGAESSKSKRFGRAVLWPLQGLDKVWYNRDRRKWYGNGAATVLGKLPCRPPNHGDRKLPGNVKTMAIEVFPTHVGVDQLKT